MKRQRLFSGKNEKKYLNRLSAGIFTQYAVLSYWSDIVLKALFVISFMP